MMWLRALAACVLMLAGCATAPAARAPALLILVSIDGFRTDYIDCGVTPTLSALAADGVHATAMRPDRHGIVNITMEDPAFPGALFRLSDRVESLNPHWWNGATPIWVSAEQHGVRTATIFWPGSEVEIHGVRPHEFAPFDQSISSDARVDRLLSWLDAPQAERPGFMTLYFDIVETEGHRFGPDSRELNAALRDVDAALARL